MIILIIDYIVAKKFAEIAEMKGHEGSTYFWFTFLLGLVGMLMVFALPDKKSVIAENKPIEPSVILRNSASEKEKVVPPITVHKWLCDDCQKMRTKTPCEHCGKK